MYIYRVCKLCFDFLFKNVLAMFAPPPPPRPSSASEKFAGIATSFLSLFFYFALHTLPKWHFGLKGTFHDNDVMFEAQHHLI